MFLHDFDAPAFLRDYWQKQPLLIRGAFDAWRNPLAPEELVGLARVKGIEARLILQKPKGLRVSYGPFTRSRFARLDGKAWTLLVQAVDRVVPHVAALLDAFRFIPDWRIDDVMVSYATDGGGVGAHFDQYDVFLIQGLGQRRWRIGELCDAETPLLPHDDLRLIATFEPVEDWVLGPGDMLYLPPRIAHEGVAIGNDCMTYSIGFRAPARSELIAHWCDHVLAELDEDDRYADPDLTIQADPEAISSAAIDRLYAMVIDKIGDRDAFARWFASYVAMRKSGADEDG